MRFLDIPPFSTTIEITDPESFYTARLGSGLSAKGSAGTLLLGYMIAPNDLTARTDAMAAIQKWLDCGEYGPLPSGLRTMQQHWTRVADIIHLHHDIASGGHQERRGGASLGKAIHLASKIADSKGTGEAQLWAIWKTYKDVAHLVSAAVIVAADIQERHKNSSLDLNLQQLLPFRITLLMPERIIGLAMTVEQYGLLAGNDDKRASLFDAETLWRIPSDIGITPLPMPSRRVRPVDLAILNARRAGNRGKNSQHETTPVL